MLISIYLKKTQRRRHFQLLSYNKILMSDKIMSNCLNVKIIVTQTENENERKIAEKLTIFLKKK